jgi:Kef-type K+ transport system membrane component KefB
VGKVGGCSIAARHSGLSWREASSVGIMMNTRGLMELIVLNAGYDLGIIPKPVFFIFVIIAFGHSGEVSSTYSYVSQNSVSARSTGSTN